MSEELAPIQHLLQSPAHPFTRNLALLDFLPVDKGEPWKVMGEDVFIFRGLQHAMLTDDTLVMTGKTGPCARVITAQGSFLMPVGDREPSHFLDVFEATDSTDQPLVQKGDQGAIAMSVRTQKVIGIVVGRSNGQKTTFIIPVRNIRAAQSALKKMAFV